MTKMHRTGTSGENENAAATPAVGLHALIGQHITLLCVNYFYTAGVLAEVLDNCVKLTAASIVYETGAWNSKNWSDAQKLPYDVYVVRSAVEAFGVMK